MEDLTRTKAQFKLLIPRWVAMNYSGMVRKEWEEEKKKIIEVFGGGGLRRDKMWRMWKIWLGGANANKPLAVFRACPRGDDKEEFKD